MVPDLKPVPRRATWARCWLRIRTAALKTRLAKNPNAARLRPSESPIDEQPPRIAFPEIAALALPLSRVHVFLAAGRFTLLRFALFFKFETAHVLPWNVLLAFAAGFYRDVIAALWFMLPPLAWRFLVGNRPFASLAHRLWFRFFMTLLWAVPVFFLAAEFFFFDEFKSRFNPVAVDYLVYPREVFINIGTRIPCPPSWAVVFFLARSGCGSPGDCARRCGRNRSGLARGFSGSPAR